MLKELVDKKEKKVEYIELIYDLIFVYIIGRNNALLHNLKDGFVETGFFLSYIFCTLAVIQIWTFTTYYINVYGKKGVREHIFLFVNMFLLYFLAQGIGSDWQALHNQFHIAWALILLNIAVQYAIELRHHKEIYHQKRIKHMVAVLVSEAAIVLLCILEFEKRGSTMLSFAAVIFGILFVLVASRNSCSALVDFNHLSERAMLYVVFTFGEMIIAIASYFEGDFNLNSLYFSLLAFAIVVGLFLSYGVFYDHILDHEKQTNGIGYILIHIFIIFALNNITVALEFMRNEQVHILPKIAMMLGSMLLYFAFLFAAVQGRHRRENDPTRGRTGGSKRQFIVVVISRFSVFIVPWDWEDAVGVAGLLPDAVTVFTVAVFLADQSQRGELFDRAAHRAFRAETLFCNRSDRRKTVSLVPCAEDEVTVHRKRNRFETEVKDARVHLIKASAHISFLLSLHSMTFSLSELSIEKIACPLTLVNR